MRFQGSDEICKSNAGNEDALSQLVNILVFPKGTHLLKSIAEKSDIEVVITDKKISECLHVVVRPYLLTVLVHLLCDVLV